MNTHASNVIDAIPDVLSVKRELGRNLREARLLRSLLRVAEQRQEQCEKHGDAQRAGKQTSVMGGV